MSSFQRSRSASLPRTYVPTALSANLKKKETELKSESILDQKSNLRQSPSKDDDGAASSSDEPDNNHRPSRGRIISSPKIDRLTDSNWRTWKYDAKCILDDCQLWDFENDLPVKGWESLKNLGYLVSSCQKERIIPQTKKDECGRRAWEKLKSIHEKPTFHKEINLITQLTSTKWTEGTILDHADKLKFIRNQIQECGTTIQDRFLVGLLLASLPPSYNTFLQSIDTSDPNNLKYDDLVARVHNQIVIPDDFENQSLSTNKFTKRKYCRICKTNDHNTKKCSKFDKEKSKNHGLTTMALSTSNSIFHDKWIIDTGASGHYTNRQDLLSNLTPVSKEYSVVVGNGKVLQATHKGEAIINNCTIKPVYLIPDLDKNLIAPNLFLDNGCRVDITKTGISVWKHGKKQLESTREHGMYVLPATVRSISLYQAHCILGHANYDSILSTQSLGKLPFDLTDRTKVECKACVVNKFSRTIIPKNAVHKTTRRGQMVHFDTWGPAPIKGLSGENYVLFFVDSYTQYVSLKFMKVKSEAPDHILQYIQQFQSLFGKTLHGMKSDRAAEYLGKRIEANIIAKGVHHYKTAGHSSHQNGCAERMIRTITEMARSMLYESGLPLGLWPQAFTMAALAYNHTTSKKHNTLPAITFWGVRYEPLKSEKFHKFGQPIAVRTESQIHKLQPRANFFHYVGFSPHENGVKYLKSNKILTTRNYKLVEGPTEVIIKQPTAKTIRVNIPAHPTQKSSDKYQPETTTGTSSEDHRIDTNEESELPGVSSTSPSSSIGLEVREELTSFENPVEASPDQQIDHSLLPPDEVPRSPKISSDQPGNNTPEIRALERVIDIKSKVLDFERKFTLETPREVIDALPPKTKFSLNGRSYTTTKTPGKYSSSYGTAYYEDFGRTAPVESLIPKHNRRNDRAPPDKTSSEPSQNQLNFCLATTLKLSESQAANNKDVFEARVKEYEAIKANNTFILVPLNDVPPNRNILPCRFVDSIKKDAAGFDLYKSRLVAGGHRQIKGIDFDHVFAPVVKAPSIRLLLAITVSLGWQIRQLDFVTAFLNAPLSELVYMRQPKMFQDGTDRVCLLKKGLYGLAQSPKCWNTMLISIFSSMGFKQLQTDRMLFFNNNFHNHPVICGIHVDDEIAISPSIESLKELEKAISIKAKIKTLGLPSRLLSINLQITEQSILLDQIDYIEKTLKNFNIDKFRSKVPAKKISAETSDNDARFPCQKYQQAIGALIWISTNTRPDISYSVSKAAEKMADPKISDWKQVMTILGYLNETKKYKLTYCKPSKPELNVDGYADADFATDYITRRSRSGYLIFVNQCAIIWSSKRQRSVSTSTVEAEYMAASDAAQDLIWVSQLLKELELNGKMHTTLKMDNQGAQAIAKDPVNHQKTKHIDIRYHYLRERVQNRELKVEYLSTKDMIADLLTKPLSAPDTDKHRNAMGLRIDTSTS